MGVIQEQHQWGGRMRKRTVLVNVASSRDPEYTDLDVPVLQIILKGKAIFPFNDSSVDPLQEVQVNNCLKFLSSSQFYIVKYYVYIIHRVYIYIHIYVHIDVLCTHVCVCVCVCYLFSHV